MKISIFNLLLFPFFLIYLLGANLRNWLYNSNIYRSVRFDVPIINVGNLSAGGNGKTPHVEYILNLMADHYKIAVLSRGYGRKSRGFHEVSINDSPLFSGDEPVQIKQGFGDLIKVFVGEDRVEAITQIMFNNPEIELVILDDAFQHRAIKPGLNLLLTDYSLPFYRDSLLPIGRLREPKSGAKRADVVIITKCPNQLSNPEKEKIRADIQPFCNNIVFSGLKYENIIPFSLNQEPTKNRNFFLVTGIAKHELLEEYVRLNFNLIGTMHFRDHHQFTQSDIAAIEQKLSNFADSSVEILTTSKDAVRFRGMKNAPKFKINIITVVPEFQIDDSEKFNQIIKDYVRKSSADSSIHSNQD